MKKNYIVAFALALVSQFVFLNTYSQHSSRMSGNLIDMPDVNNKFQTSETVFENQAPYRNPETIAIFPNWPLEYQGPSYRAGIYANMDTDPELELIYNVRQQVHVWNIDGTNVPGWPQATSNGNCFLYRGPSFGDINGDGEDDVVVSTGYPGTGVTGWLYAFNKDGSPITGFPLQLPNGGASYGPVLEDLNNDGDLEIIVAERGNWPTGFVGVYDGDGSNFPGFPQALDHVPAAKVAVGDINGDATPEIIVESLISVYAFNTSGNVLTGFPYNLGNGDDRVLSYSSPVLADLDNDGHREIIFGDHSYLSHNGAVHVVKSDGTLMSGWPQYTGHWIYAPPSVADIDGDGSLDIAIGDNFLNATPACRVFVWDKDGNALTGWPSSFVNSVNSQIIIANLDADEDLEMIWDDNTVDGVYIGYNHDGTPMGGDWPLSTTPNHSTHFTNPFVTDIDNDGFLDISGACRDQNEYFDFYLWNTDVPYDETKAILPVIQYDVQHTGVYQGPNSAGINDVATQKLVSVYPNPVKNVLNIRIKNVLLNENAHLEIVDLLGKSVYTNEITSSTNNVLQIDSSDFTKGVYLLKYTINNQSSVHKIIKQ